MFTSKSKSLKGGSWLTFTLSVCFCEIITISFLYSSRFTFRHIWEPRTLITKESVVLIWLSSQLGQHLLQYKCSSPSYCPTGGRNTFGRCLGMFFCLCFLIFVFASMRFFVQPQKLQILFVVGSLVHLIPHNFPVPPFHRSLSQLPLVPAEATHIQRLSGPSSFPWLITDVSRHF